MTVLGRTGMVSVLVYHSVVNSLCMLIGGVCEKFGDHQQSYPTSVLFALSGLQTTGYFRGVAAFGKPTTAE